MDWLEEELRNALARKEPSPDFAARVHDAVRRPRTVFNIRPWLAAAASLIVMGSAGGAAWRHHQGVQAKQRVMLAVRITAAKLNQIQNHVREVNR